MDQNRQLGFLYGTPFGRCILKVLVRPWVSKTVGAYMNSGLSKHRVKRFIAENGIDMSSYEDREYTSFNDFFTRRLRPGARVVTDEPGAFVCPCDSRLSAYRVTPELTFFIKGSPYSVSSLLGGDGIADSFSGGSCLVFRLCVDDYHRYCRFDSGSERYRRRIPGVLHTVNPISLGRYNFFTMNSREYAVLDTKHFGVAAQAEIGAMMVGRICNKAPEDFRAGDEKGYFEFGGSTVAVLLGKGYQIRDEFYAATLSGEEIRVLYGQKLS